MRIAVVGAGPAGIFAVRGLRQRFGDKIQIDLYGDPTAAQFHTFVDPIDPSITFDIGTCYVHRGYDNSILPLVRELGLTLDVENNSPYSKGTSTIELPSWTKALMIAGAFSYLGMHHRLWLLLRNTLPGMYSMSASSYIVSIGMGALMETTQFQWCVVGQGYGWLDRICADRFFEWMDSGLITTARQRMHGAPGTFLIREGYGTMFHLLYDRLQANKRAGDWVQSVVSVKDGVRLGMATGPPQDYDHVVLACDFSKIDGIPRKLIPDRTSIDVTWLISFVFTSTELLQNLDTYTTNIIRGHKQDVPICIVYRGTRYQEGRLLHWYWSIGYASGPQSTTSDALCHVVSQLCVSSQIRDRYFRIFEYNVRPSAQLVREGFRRRVQAYQGQDRVWYTGGLCSHWDVDSIYEHVDNLIGDIPGTLIHP